MVTSLKKEFSILIYEKEKLLNSILYYQISNHNNFKVSVADNNLEMFEVLNKKKFDTYIINLNFLNEDLKKFYDIFEINNNTIISLAIMNIILKIHFLLKIKYFC